MSPADEEDLAPIGGVDEDDGRSLEEEMTVLSEAKQQDLLMRFKKTADGVYVEAKRSAIGGMTQVPLYFYGLLLALGWNEIMTGRSIPIFSYSSYSFNTSYTNFSQFSETPSTLFSSSLSLSAHMSPTPSISGVP